MASPKRIDILTIFPEQMKYLLSFGVLSQGQKKNVFEIFYHDLRKFTDDVHKSVDGRPYGGGEGMVMMCEPLEKTWQNVPKLDNRRFIYLSPQGKKFDAQKAEELSHYDQLIFLCGRYEGVDERFLQNCDEEISIGDYILSGGEFPCAIVIDGTSRFYEGVLSNKNSAQKDTFAEGLLKYPQYTRPPEYKGMKVPEILMGGNHKAIDDFRRKVALLRTHFKRPDLMYLKHEKDPSILNELDKAFKLLEDLSPEERKTLGLPNIEA